MSAVLLWSTVWAQETPKTCTADSKAQHVCFFSCLFLRSRRVFSKYSWAYSAQSEAEGSRALENLQSRINYNRAASAYSRGPLLKLWILGVINWIQSNYSCLVIPMTGLGRAVREFLKDDGHFRPGTTPPPLTSQTSNKKKNSSLLEISLLYNREKTICFSNYC